MIRGVLRPIAVGLAVPIAVFGGTLGVLGVGLHRSSATDRLAVRVLQKLERSSSPGATLVIGDRRIEASCTAIAGNRATVRLADGTRLVITGTHVARTMTGTGRNLLDAEPPDLIAAEADLSGSSELYARELAGTIFTGRVALRSVRYGSRPAYKLSLGDGRPVVELVVDSQTLRPLAVRYRSRTVSGTSTLRTSASRSSGGC